MLFVPIQNLGQRRAITNRLWLRSNVAPSEVLQKLPERFSIASLESAFLPSVVDKLLDEPFIEHHHGQLPSRQPLPEIAKQPQFCLRGRTGIAVLRQGCCKWRKVRTQRVASRSFVRGEALQKLF